jgi:hypothetical protein
MLNGPRLLTAAQQILFLRANPISGGRGTLAAGRLTWFYEASPTPISRTYAVRIEYRQDVTPHVFIDKPNLIELADGRRLPHVYQQHPTRLCLYFPNGEWQAWMRLDQTVVPWTDLWLFYFEEWLASNLWKGGGLHPRIHARHRRHRRHWSSAIESGSAERTETQEESDGW